MKQDIVALIPVREGSQRVKGKNFIEFSDGKSLLDLKIEQVKKAGCFKHIYISSDSANVERIAKSKGVEFLKRDTKYCGADVPWAECASHIVSTIPGNPLVVWTLTTSPLFENFSGAVKKFTENKSEFDSLVAVLPMKAFFLNQHGRGINYNPGHWHPYSQQLETYFKVTGSCFMGLKEDMLRWSYWFGPKPILFATSNEEAVDVDTPEDFDFAKKLYRVKHS